jgi:hypothetical protein
MSEERSWRETRFEDRGGRTGGSSWLGVAAGLLVIANFIVLLAAIQHDENRCGQDCYDVGLRTNEPGHSWTSYNGSWQWEAMYLLGVAAFVASLAAAFAVWRDERAPRAARIAPVVAAGLGAAWVAWRVLAPAVHA